MFRPFRLFAIALAVVLSLATSMNAKAGGSDAWLLSLYTCSDVYWGSVKVGDNCVSTEEEKLDVMDSLRDDGDDDE